MTGGIDTTQNTITLAQLQQISEANIQVSDPETATILATTSPIDQQIISGQIATRVAQEEMVPSSTSPPELIAPTMEDIDTANAAISQAAATNSDFMSIVDEHSGNIVGYILSMIVETGVQTATEMLEISNQASLLSLSYAATKAQTQITQAEEQKKASDLAAYGQIATGVTQVAGGVIAVGMGYKSLSESTSTGTVEEEEAVTGKASGIGPNNPSEDIELEEMGASKNVAKAGSNIEEEIEETQSDTAKKNATDEMQQSKAKAWATMGQGAAGFASGAGSITGGIFSVLQADAQYKADLENSKITKLDAQQNYVANLASSLLSIYQSQMSIINSMIQTGGSILQTLALANKKNA